MRDEIKTKRLRLRQLRMSDATRIARFCDDPGVGRNLAMTPLPYLETAADGYWFGRPYWGKGFATEALQALTSAARSLGALEAGHFVDNPASGRVLSKGGFGYTGETKPLFSMARGASVPCKRMHFASALEQGAPEITAIAV